MQNRKQASHLEIKQRSEVQSSIKQATLSAEATDAYVTSPLSVSLGVLPCLSEALYTIYWCFSYTREVSFQKAIDLLQVPSSTSTTLPSENGSDHGFATLEERKQEEFYRIIKACSSSASSFHSHFRSAYLNRVLCKLIGAAWKGDPGIYVYKYVCLLAFRVH